MESIERRIDYFHTRDGRAPYLEWHTSLHDIKTQATVDVRIARLQAGNFGNCRPVGEGVLELKIDYGPGYRVYLGLLGPRGVLLLTGGDKSAQKSDIRIAKGFWRDYKARNL